MSYNVIHTCCFHSIWQDVSLLEREKEREEGRERWKGSKVREREREGEGEGEGEGERKINLGHYIHSLPHCTQGI